MLGENAAVVVEGVETHTRTGFIDLAIAEVRGPARESPPHGARAADPRKVFGWYDNEMGATRDAWVSSTASLARGMARQAGSTPAVTRTDSHFRVTTETIASG